MRHMLRQATASIQLRPISGIWLKPNWVAVHSVNAIISADEKRVRLWHACLTDKGVEIATGEQMLLHVDLKAGAQLPLNRL